MEKQYSIMWGPQTLCECWFINPIRILGRYLRIINHSEIGVINAPTERYRKRGPHIVGLSHDYNPSTR